MKSGIRGMVWLALLLGSGLSVAAELFGLELERSEREDRVSVLVSEKVPVTVFLLGHPDRVVADFEALSLREGVDFEIAPGRWIRAVRHGFHAGGKLRLVFDLSTMPDVDLSFEPKGQGGAFILKMSLPPVPAPVEEAPVEEAPVEEAPVEEA
ncbi:MAG: AMIN domain-containing protein, partial [Rhodocyclaceae bacterium]|nr:AMIN domain-containing protein [Rhodocyclaceae bacterium]